MRPSTPGLTAAVAAASLAAYLVPGAAEWLQFDRAALARGEVWRAFTGHLTHFGPNHLAWDLAVLVALGWICEPVARVRTGAALLLGAISISLALWFCQPQLQLYRGLSGLDCALGGLLGATLLRRGRAAARFAGALTLVLLGAKCLWEVNTVRTLFAAGRDYVPVPLAHLLGLLAGVAVGAQRLGGRHPTPASPCAGSNHPSLSLPSAPPPAAAR